MSHVMFAFYGGIFCGAAGFALVLAMCQAAATPKPSPDHRRITAEEREAAGRN